MRNFEEDKIWQANGETRRRESFANQLPPIQEEEKASDFGTVTSRDFGNGGGGQGKLPVQQEAEADEKVLWNVELRGGKRSS